MAAYNRSYFITDEIIPYGFPWIERNYKLTFDTLSFP